MIKIFKCTFCKGTGSDPFELLSPHSGCLVCNNTGWIQVEEPQKKCPFCLGSGRNPLGARVPCIVCGGRGFNHVESNTKCPQCNGSGKSSDGLPCTRCKGVGIT